MRRFSLNFVKKSKFLVLGAILTLAVGAAGTAALLQPTSSEQTVSAANCDKVNIVHCGFNGPNKSNYINQLQRHYKNGSDGRFNDLKRIYRWAGATDAMINNMNGQNTKLGTMHANGDIYVNGKKVGHDAKMAARFRDSNWTGVVRIKKGVWARNVTHASTAHNRYKVLVHFDRYGQADFAVAVDCGNAVKFVPIKKQPRLVCQDLTVSHLGGRQYRFTAQANARNTRITSYTFRFGDGDSKTVRTSRESASTTHTFNRTDKAYSGRVAIDSTRKDNVTSSRCDFRVKTPAPQPALVCKNLTFELGSKDMTYDFTARANAENTEITSYVFHFGDGESQTVNTSSETANASHTFAQHDNTFHASVVVNSADKEGVTSNGCKVSVTTPEKPAQPQLVCTELSFQLVGSDQENTYQFNATASAKDTQITSYVFKFGDGESQTVNTSDETAEVTHTYARGDMDFTATVTVNSEDVQNVTSVNCQVTVPAQPQPEECKPGVPVGSPECEPEELPETGAGSVIGFFGATSLAGGLIHRLILRRRISA